ncbi:MAG: N-6 DNA methylase [Chloroflexi bacterium]|nr:N-6 DNA methylase [Chloroflexota bacterium]
MAKVSVVDAADVAPPERKRGRRRNGASERGQTGRQGLDSIIWRVCDILRRSNCAGALQYVPELTWLLFLRILDESEENEAAEARAVGDSFTLSLEAPYRWRDWAAPGAPKRVELAQYGTLGSFFQFVHADLLPYLRGLRERPNATPRQRVISEIMSGVERVRVDTEKNFQDVLDKLDEIHVEAIDPTHMFTLSQVYEGLLLRMGEKGNDGGQFFTPREVIRALVQVVAPKVGETVYDPCCGTGGFLVQAYERMMADLNALGNEATGEQIETLKRRTFYGREKENLVYPIGLANLVLHGIDEPHIWHGNTLTGSEQYGGLYQDAPSRFDVVLTNPPFGGKEGSEAQTNFVHKTSATQVLFLQHVIDSLNPGGRCGIVLDEGVLFRTTEKAFVGTKRKLLDDCAVTAIVSLPGGVFTAAGAGVKTNLLFFQRGGPTEKVWYYDLSDVKVGKKTPLTLGHFDDFFQLYPSRGDSDRSWTVTREQIVAKNYDLKAVNPNARAVEDTRTPAELLDAIEAKGREVADALKTLRALMASEA